MARYGANDIYAMPMDEAVEYFNEIEKMHTEDKLYLRWIVGPQFQMGFKEFCDALIPPKMIPEEEVIKRIEKIFGEEGEEYEHI